MCFYAWFILELCLAFAMKFMDDLLIELPIGYYIFLEPLADVTILRPGLIAETALVFVDSVYI